MKVLGPLVLFVAVEREAVLGSEMAFEELCKAQEAIDILVEPIRHLDFVVADTPNGGVVLDRLRPAVVQPLARRNVVVLERVAQTDGLPNVHRQRRPSRQPVARNGAGELRMDQSGVDAVQIRTDRFRKADVMSAARSIERRTLEQTRAETCEQRR